MAKTVIDELVTILSVDVKSGTAPIVQQFSSMLQGVTHTAAFATAGLFATAGAIMASGAAIFDFALNQTHTASAMERLSRTTGISTKELEQWSFAAEAFGGDAEEMKRDLVALEDTAASILPGQFNIWFKRAGVDPFNIDGTRKKAAAMFEEWLKFVQDPKMSLEAKREIVHGLGLSDNILLFQSKSMAEIKKKMSEAPLTSKEDFARAREFENEWKTFVAKYSHTKMEMGLNILPSLQRVIDFYYDVIRHKEPGEEYGLAFQPWVEKFGKTALEFLTHTGPGWMDSKHPVEQGAGISNSVFHVPIDDGRTPTTGAYQGPVTPEESMEGVKNAYNNAVSLGSRFLDRMSQDLYGKKGTASGPVAHAPGLGQAPQSVTTKKTEINITQHITGDNPKAIADESAEGITQVLQILFPGGLTPVSQ